MSVFVVPHDPGWREAFLAEAAAIGAVFGAVPVRLHHIGSTAIAGILAKPIIDLLGEVADLVAAEAATPGLMRLGYEAMGEFGIEGRRYFRKIDGAGRRTHHLHVYEAGSPHVERHLAFRDYLRAHDAVAAEYSALKARLAGGEAPSWEAYVDGKDPFVRKVESDAVAWYRRRGAG